MICALTVRTLKPGTFDQFREAFMRPFTEEPPEGWVRFNMVRNAENSDEVVCFGFFNGSAEDLRRSAAEGGYEEQMAAIAPYVQSVGADGMFEVVEDRTPESQRA